MRLYQRDDLTDTLMAYTFFLRLIKVRDEHCTVRAVVEVGAGVGQRLLNAWIMQVFLAFAKCGTKFCFEEAAHGK
jgi:hypothetical protein